MLQHRLVVCGASYTSRAYSHRRLQPKILQPGLTEGRWVHVESEQMEGGSKGQSPALALVALAEDQME